jgi:photosystem II stability/assembly factor-like uncharacterized protein
MNEDVLGRLRASNPLPGGSDAPPIEDVLARLNLNLDAPRARRRRRSIGVLAPVLGAAVAVLVLVVALTGLHRAHPHVHRSTQPPAPKLIPHAPRGGMRGLVTVWGAGFASTSDGVISLQQCLGCRNGAPTAHSTYRYWLATTRDAGLSWSLTPQRYYLQQPMFVGANGWAGGLKAAASGGGGIAEYYVTHDGGHSWSVAPAAAPNEGGALVSIAGGEVWAVGLTTRVAILHAPVTASRLDATTSQPIQGSWTNVEVIAAGPGTAYVSNGDVPRQTFVTHDDGHSWQRIPPPCAGGERGVPASAYGDTVWAVCSSTQGPRITLARSLDGGRTWQQLNCPAVPRNGVQAVSPRVAWMLTITGQIWRTTDAGQIWRAKWSAASSEPKPLRSNAPAIAAGLSMLPQLIAQTPTSATVLTLLTRGHDGRQAAFTNLAMYRTSDGGRTWRPYVVALGQR